MIVSAIMSLLAANAQVMSIPVEFPEWVIECPAGKQGRDGEPLCNALASSQPPPILVERVDQGMEIKQIGLCTPKQDRTKIIENPSIVVPLKRGVSGADIQKAFNENLLVLLNATNEICGYSSKLIFDQKQVAEMVEAVFVAKNETKK
ncbi:MULTISPECIES: hypothetical protein [unclassified Sphingopyxis]|uniref:hypothetical protein n=1 Tax=unclassified Sphingopyxis TaxID=2614943 RepID=UPI000B2CA137|nr:MULTISPECIES: hypothetical protein [unclassified Sphingopyxis]USI75848.1 hypothetical protein KEC45_13845 [Sphingopyxis sp. USTB-05]